MRLPLRRLLSTLGSARQGRPRADLQLFEASDDETLAQVTASFTVEQNFVTAEEESRLIDETEPHLKRLRYEDAHWDGAILGYREVERKHWSAENRLVMDRIRAYCFEPKALHLPMVHCLDVAKDGEIKPHVDAVRFCGDPIVGLSLMSTAIMRLALERDSSRWVKILLPQRSIYIMSGTTRYDFTHAILAEHESTFKDKRVHRERRISVMFRVEPSNPD